MVMAWSYNALGMNSGTSIYLGSAAVNDTGNAFYRPLWIDAWVRFTYRASGDGSSYPDNAPYIADNQTVDSCAIGYLWAGDVPIEEDLAPWTNRNDPRWFGWEKVDWHRWGPDLTVANQGGFTDLSYGFRWPAAELRRRIVCPPKGDPTEKTAANSIIFCWEMISPSNSALPQIHTQWAVYGDAEESTVTSVAPVQTQSRH